LTLKPIIISIALLASFFTIGWLPSANATITEDKVVVLYNETGIAGHGMVVGWRKKALFIALPHHIWLKGVTKITGLGDSVSLESIQILDSVSDDTKDLSIVSVALKPTTSVKFAAISFLDTPTIKLVAGAPLRLLAQNGNADYTFRRHRRDGLIEAQGVARPGISGKITISEDTRPVGIATKSEQENFEIVIPMHAIGEQLKAMHTQPTKTWTSFGDSFFKLRRAILNDIKTYPLTHSMSLDGGFVNAIENSTASIVIKQEEQGDDLWSLEVCVDDYECFFDRAPNFFFSWLCRDPADGIVALQFAKIIGDNFESPLSPSSFPLTLKFDGDKVVRVQRLDFSSDASLRYMKEKNRPIEDRDSRNLVDPDSFTSRFPDQPKYVFELPMQPHISNPDCVSEKEDIARDALYKDYRELHGKLTNSFVSGSANPFGNQQLMTPRGEEIVPAISLSLSSPFQRDLFPELITLEEFETAEALFSSDLYALQYRVLFENEKAAIHYFGDHYQRHIIEGLNFSITQPFSLVLEDKTSESFTIVTKATRQFLIGCALYDAGDLCETTIPKVAFDNECIFDLVLHKLPHPHRFTFDICNKTTTHPIGHNPELLWTGEHSNTSYVLIRSTESLMACLYSFANHNFNQPLVGNCQPLQMDSLFPLEFVIRSSSGPRPFTNQPHYGFGGSAYKFTFNPIDRSLTAHMSNKAYKQGKWVDVLSDKILQHTAIEELPDVFK